MADPTDQEVELAGRLIERLLVDPEFRAEFRRDPSGACVAAGLPGLAGELGGSGKAMHTMELRESRSSLAGVVMAIAAEGIALEQVERLAAHGLAGGVGEGVAWGEGAARAAGVAEGFAIGVGAQVGAQGGGLAGGVEAGGGGRWFVWGGGCCWGFVGCGRGGV